MSSELFSQPMFLGQRLELVFRLVWGGNQDSEWTGSCGSDRGGAWSICETEQDSLRLSGPGVSSRCSRLGVGLGLAGGF